MSAGPIPAPDPALDEKPRPPNNTASGATPPSTTITEEELDLLMEFFATLRELGHTR